MNIKSIQKSIIIVVVSQVLIRSQTICPWKAWYILWMNVIYFINEHDRNCKPYALSASVSSVGDFAAQFAVIVPFSSAQQSNIRFVCHHCAAVLLDDGLAAQMVWSKAMHINITCWAHRHNAYIQYSWLKWNLLITYFESVDGASLCHSTLYTFNSLSNSSGYSSLGSLTTTLAHSISSRCIIGWMCPN